MSEHTVVAAPVDGATERRLVIRNLDNATLVGEDSTAELCRVRCAGRAPRVRYSGDKVELTYPLIALTHPTPDTISLSSSISWEIEVGHMGNVRADLTAVTVRSIDVGDVVRTNLDLSNSEGTVPIRLGAAHELTIRRPPGVPVRVRIHGGARRVRVDGQHVGAGRGPTTIVTPGYERATNRLDISVDSAADLAVVAADLSGPAATGPWEVMAAAHTWLARLRAGRVVWPVQESSRMFV
jgi:hypothetical protein